MSLLVMLGVAGLPLASQAQLREAVPNIISGYATPITLEGVGFKQSRTYLRVQSSGKSFDFELESGSNQRSGYVSLERATAPAKAASLMRSMQLGNASCKLRSFVADPAAHA